MTHRLDSRPLEERKRIAKDATQLLAELSQLIEGNKRPGLNELVRMRIAENVQALCDLLQGFWFFDTHMAGKLGDVDFYAGEFYWSTPPKSWGGYDEAYRQLELALLKARHGFALLQKNELGLGGTDSN